MSIFRYDQNGPFRRAIISFSTVSMLVGERCSLFCGLHSCKFSCAVTLTVSLFFSSVFDLFFAFPFFFLSSEKSRIRLPFLFSIYCEVSLLQERHPVFLYLCCKVTAPTSPERSPRTSSYRRETSCRSLARLAASLSRDNGFE